MSITNINHVSFKAHFAASLKGQNSLGYSDLKAREENVSREFSLMTKDDKNHRLLDTKCRDMGSDEFCLWKKNDNGEETLVTKMRVDFTKYLSKMTDKEAAQTLVGIMDLMKLRGQQNEVISKLIDERDEIIFQKNLEIKQTRDEQNSQFVIAMENKGLSSDSGFPYLIR